MSQIAVPVAPMTERNGEATRSVNQRALVLFKQHQERIFRRTDHMFAWLMVFQWAAGLAAALWIAPRTWTGPYSQTNVHVWAALLLGGAITSLPVGLALFRPGLTSTRHVIGIGQMLMSALLIHLTGGRIETHFHVFGSLAFLAFYRDWRVLISATVVVAVDHFLRGLFWPQSVYGIITGGEWRWLEHAGWVIFEDFFLILASVQSVHELEKIAERQARVEDALEVEKARDAAVTANLAKSAFMANMSHELRTPLNAIIGYSEMLKEEAEDLGQANLLSDLEKIRGAGRHLLGLINDILDLSKIEAGKMELFVENFDIAEVVQDTISTIRPLVEKNANVLDISCPAGLGAMRADLTKVRQIMFNLLSNASKFTEKGRISFVASRTQSTDQDWITFQVNDTGIGMSADQVARLFQDFSQVADSSRMKYGGTGLGLSISRRFCEMMGGEILVDSELGKGSTFTVRLPAEVVKSGTASPAPIRREVRSTPASSTPSGDTILAIDDDPAVLDLLSRALAKEGFRIVTANTGQDGLHLAKKLRPMIITLDVMMPKMDGWAVLTALKADQDLAEIPVIMLSMMSDLNMGYSLGASDYLMKPIDRKRLISVLEKHQSPRPASEVLLVEDDLTTRQMMRRLLESLGCNVIEAENGRVACEWLNTHEPQLVLLDLMMPEMDGFQFLEEVRRHDSWKSIPIVVLTAMDLSSEDHGRLNGSVQQILQKGACSREELMSRLREWVGNCRPKEKAKCRDRGLGTTAEVSAHAPGA